MTVSTDSPNQGAILPLDTDENGGDGDCAPVPRNIITSLQMDSGAMADLAPGPGPGPTVIPNAPNSIVIGDEGGGGGVWGTIAESGGATVVAAGPSSAGPIRIAVDSLHKAALNIGLLKTGGGFDEVRIWCEADYGFGYAPVPGSTFDFKMGSPFPVEQPAMSLEAPIFSASYIPGPAAPPDVRWKAQLLQGVGGNVTITRAYFYVVQLFPVFSAASINNCEAALPPCVQPITAEVTDNFGAVTAIGIGTGPGNTVIVPVPPGGGIWALDVSMGAAFDQADYTAEILKDGVPVAVLPPFLITALPPGPTQTVWHFEMEITPPSTADVWTVRVSDNANPSCVWEQGFAVTVTA